MATSEIRPATRPAASSMARAAGIREARHLTRRLSSALANCDFAVMAELARDIARLADALDASSDVRGGQ